MNTGLISLLLRLSRRERLLVAALVFAVLPLGIFLTVLVPLHDHRLQAQATEAEAQALLVWVADQTVEKINLQQPDLSAVPASAIGLSGLESGLRAAGLGSSLGELRSGTGGTVEMRFERADFARLANWLSTTHPDWGYRFKGFRFEATDAPNQVNVWLTLSPASDP